MLPHIKPLIVRKLHSGKMSLDLKLTPSTWSAVPLPLVSSDTAAGGSMILLPFKEVRIQFQFRQIPKVGLLESTIWGPSKAKVVPSQAM